MVTETKCKWWIWLVATGLICGCAGAPRPRSASTAAPPYYQEALRAYWSESNSTAFVLASLAVEKDPDLQHVQHAAYMVGVLASEKLSTAELNEALSDSRIAHLMLDIYARGLRALKTNDAPLAFRAFRDFTLSTPSERWRFIGLSTSLPPGWRQRNLPGELDQNLQLAELALKSGSDPALAGQLAETAVGPESKAQKIRAAQIMVAVFERTGDLAWAEKAFARGLETQQIDLTEELAQRILTNKSATVITYVSVGSGYARAGQLQRAEEVLTATSQRFGNESAELVLARIELYRRQRRYDDALNELLRAGRELKQFRREHYHPVWAKQIDAVALATGPDDSVYAITGESRPRVLQLNREGEVVARYGPFDDPTNDGLHPFAVFKDGSFLIRNRRWSPDGQVLQELPLSSSIRAVCIDRDWRVLAFGPTDGVKILSDDGRILTHLRCDEAISQACRFCPCSAIAANEDKILLVARNGVLHLNDKGSFFGPFGDGGSHDIAAGRDGLFCLSSSDKVKIIRITHFHPWELIDSIPLGGGDIAWSTAGGFYVAGVTTESGVWLLKYAPPLVPRD